MDRQKQIVGRTNCICDLELKAMTSKFFVSPSVESDDMNTQKTWTEHKSSHDSSICLQMTMTLHINYSLESICSPLKELRSVSDTVINTENPAWTPINASLPSRKLFTYLIKLGEKQSSHACSFSSFFLPSTLFIPNANRKSMWSSLATPGLTSPSGRELTSLGATSNPSQLLALGFFVFAGLRKHIYINDCHILCQLLTPLWARFGACFSFLAAADWGWPWRRQCVMQTASRAPAPELQHNGCPVLPRCFPLG